MYKNIDIKKIYKRNLMRKLTFKKKESSAEELELQTENNHTNDIIFFSKSPLYYLLNKPIQATVSKPVKNL